MKALAGILAAARRDAGIADTAFSTLEFGESLRLDA